MQTSIVTHLSINSYRLKAFKLLLKSLKAQVVQDFELVTVVHDKNDNNIALVYDLFKEVIPNIQTSIHYLPQTGGYQANAARNLGHTHAQYPYHLLVDADMVFPCNFFEILQRKVNDDEQADCLLDVYTFLHCGTRGWSNAKLGKDIGGQIGEYYVTEQQLEEMDLESILQKGKNFADRLNKYSGLIHRSYGAGTDVHAFVKKCTKDEVTMYWRHPLAEISRKYRAEEFYFLCRRELLQAIGGWPVADRVKNRGCDKFIMTDVLYYLYDRELITIHTITDTYIMHIEHPRPYNMANDESAKRIRAEVQQHKFMKPIVNRINDFWLQKQKEVE